MCLICLSFPGSVMFLCLTCLAAEGGLSQSIRRVRQCFQRSYGSSICYLTWLTVLLQGRGEFQVVTPVGLCSHMRQERHSCKSRREKSFLVFLQQPWPAALFVEVGKQGEWVAAGSPYPPMSIKNRHLSVT